MFQRVSWNWTEKVNSKMYAKHVCSTSVSQAVLNLIIFPRSMENPKLSGLGQLNQVLLALNIDGLEPVWTLKQTRQKIFLDIIWFKTPAISDTSKKHTPETSDQRAPSPDSSPYVSQDAHAKPAYTQTSAVHLSISPLKLRGRESHRQQRKGIEKDLKSGKLERRTAIWNPPLALPILHLPSHLLWL